MQSSTNYFCVRLLIINLIIGFYCIRYFIGSASRTQKEMLADPNSKDANFITQKEFIKLNNLTRIDFLKCDIEGSEFEFIADTDLLQITQQLAIEIHDNAGDRNEFIIKLQELGLKLVH